MLPTLLTIPFNLILLSKSMETMNNSKQHAALLCSPGMGHLVPILELAKQLVAHQNFTVTIFVVSSQTSHAESQLLNSTLTNPQLCHVVQLPPPDISGLVDPNDAVVTILAMMMREVRHEFRSALLGMEVCPTMLIVDLFGTESLPIAEELGFPIKGDFVHQKEPIQIPGCRSILPQLDLDDTLSVRAHKEYLDFVEIISSGVSKGDAILVNIWEDLEPKTLAALRDEKLLGRYTKVPVYPIGPLIKPTESSGSRGKRRTLSDEQITEMAWGLELSKQRFVWVIRKPTRTADGAFFTGGNGSGGDEDSPSKYLPKGSWTAPRTLGSSSLFGLHKWTSWPIHRLEGFLSHCGGIRPREHHQWGADDCLPLYAEQRMNSTMLTEEFGVAVRSKIPPWKKVVERER
ncbi:UDP-Glycosyltransferase superfamily protein [Prunus dulcis]|uniref:UDP-Glycosyltransferase superfamily protein n=1 Tax=Prunus dulcis TaxID=3755 RepID=A0A4Y1RU42_PRUDU|nr:UDP-Glycosyltransferase superfamily protein [Prunus dulcis]